MDDGIIIEVEAGEYQVMTKSAYRGDQSTALSRIMPMVMLGMLAAAMLGLVGQMMRKLRM